MQSKLIQSEPFSNLLAQDVVTKISDVLIGVDENQLVQLWSRGAEVLYGYNAAEVVGLPLQEVTKYRWLHSADADSSYADLASKGMASGLAFHTKKDGSEIIVEFNTTIIKDGDGRPQGMVAVIHDVTERERGRMETALLPAKICSWDWNMITNEDRFFGDTEAIFGGAPGSHYSDFLKRVHPDDLTRVEAKLAASSRNHEPYKDEMRVVHPDGSIRWIRGQGRFFYDNAGTPVRMVGLNIDITEQKAREQDLTSAKAELERQKALLQTIVDNIPVMLCYMREPGKVDWVNKTWEKVLGWTPEDNRGLLAPLLYPDSKDMERVVEFIAEADGRWGEFRTTTKTGVKLDTSFLNVQLPDGTGIGIGEDITERKLAEEQLVLSRERLKVAMLAGNSGTFEWDIQKNVNRWSEELEALYGLDPGAFGGTYEAWRELVVAEDLPAAEEAARQSLLTGRLNGEWRIRRHDGKIRWISAQGRVLADMHGKPDRMIGVNMDITERKEAEENLRRSEARYRSLIEASAQVVWTCPPDGKQDREMPEWQAFTGQSAEQVRGLGWMDATHPDDLPASQSAFAEAIRSKSVFNLEQRLRRHDGVYRCMQVRGVPILDTNGEITEWIGTHTDVTEQRLAQQALVRAEKLSAAGRLAATVAHEINNPLAAVTNIHFLLAHDKTVPENARDILALADRELKRVTHMVRQTLSFYKEHTYHEQISVSALIQEVIQLYGGRLESRGARIRTELDDSLVLRTLPGELRQILSNLIANSLDALADEGTLWIRARLRKHRDGSVAKITVADTGTGIPAAVAAHIFEPFYTTKEDIGTGLGLWVAKQLIEKHHGKIAMRSRVGHGTVFVLQFPMETASLSKAS